MTLSGIDLVTTEPAAITTPLPTVTPGNIVTLAPIHVPSPIITDLQTVLLEARCFCSETSCVAVPINTLGPIKTRFPIIILVSDFN